MGHPSKTNQRVLSALKQYGNYAGLGLLAGLMWFISLTGGMAMLITFNQISPFAFWLIEGLFFIWLAFASAKVVKRVIPAYLERYVASLFAWFFVASLFFGLEAVPGLFGIWRVTLFIGTPLVICPTLGFVFGRMRLKVPSTESTQIQ